MRNRSPEIHACTDGRGRRCTNDPVCKTVYRWFESSPGTMVWIRSQCFRARILAVCTALTATVTATRAIVDRLISGDRGSGSGLLALRTATCLPLDGARADHTAPHPFADTVPLARARDEAAGTRILPPLRPRRHGNIYTRHESRIDGILIASRGFVPASPMAWTSAPHEQS